MSLRERKKKKVKVVLKEKEEGEEIMNKLMRYEINVELYWKEDRWKGFLKKLRR